MRRAFTTREKIMLVVLAVLIIAIGYFKLILEPLNEEIDSYEIATATEQDEIIQNTVKLTKMRQMEDELETIYASGDAKPLPSYDNCDNMLVELNTILSRARDYSLTFGTVKALEESTYIMNRPVKLVFKTDTYAAARSIMDSLHDSDNINRISDLSVSFDDEGSVSVTVSLSFFELAD